MSSSVSDIDRYEVSIRPLTDLSSRREGVIGHSMAALGGMTVIVIDQRYFSSSLRQVQTLDWQRSIEDKFHELAEKWLEETAHLSLTHQIVLNPHYQSIIAMGPDVIPLILRDLEEEPDHWFWALKYLCQTDPVRQEDRGDVEAMRKSWLRWGKAHGYL